MWHALRGVEYREIYTRAFLLSGLRSKFTPEWENVYLSVLRFVWEIYETRKQLYDAMFLDSIDQ